MENTIVDKVLDKIKEKGIFSEYLPEGFNLKAERFNLYGAGASHKDRIEPYSYYMSRFGKRGDRRMISIPEVAGYVSLVNFLRDNKEIIWDIVRLSAADSNSFSRIVNEEYEVIDVETMYGDEIGGVNFAVNDNEESQEEEKERSVYVENMLYKLQITSGACGILHVDISEFYRSIYTHTLSAIKLGIDGAKEAFLQESQSEDYKKYVNLDDRVRRLNGARTNGILVGPYISKILSEAILAKVDEEFRTEQLVFIRYADDYEIAIYDESGVEDVKSRIVAILDKYGFRINNEKTFYEKYPFYIFNNYQKIVQRLVGEGRNIDSVDIIELFNKFLQMEKDGEKGAVRYLLKTYKNEYHVEDKQLYASYLLNILCNDEKSLGLACNIIIHEYNAERIELNETFYNVIVKKLKYKIRKKHDLEVVWLTYLLKYTNYEITNDLLEEILKSKNDLAIIIALEEWESQIEQQEIELRWNEANSWILLYQIALKNPEKRQNFFERLSITHNVNFYNKLFEKQFSFYKRAEFNNSVIEERDIGNLPPNEEADDIPMSP